MCQEQNGKNEELLTYFLNEILKRCVRNKMEKTKNYLHTF